MSKGGQQRGDERGGIDGGNRREGRRSRHGEERSRYISVERWQMSGRRRMEESRVGRQRFLFGEGWSEGAGKQRSR